MIMRLLHDPSCTIEYRMMCQYIDRYHRVSQRKDCSRHSNRKSGFVSLSLWTYEVDEIMIDTATHCRRVDGRKKEWKIVVSRVKHHTCRFDIDNGSLRMFHDARLLRSRINHIDYSRYIPSCQRFLRINP